MITMVQKDRSKEAMLVIDTKDFQKYFVKYQDERFAFQSNQRFSDTIGGFLVSPSSLIEHFTLDLEQEWIQPTQSKCYEKVLEKKVGKFRKEVFFKEGSMIEVMKFGEKQDLEVCHYQIQDGEVDDKLLHQLREYSQYQFKHPYLMTCKGNAELVINVMPFLNKTLIFPIKDCKFCY